jgi:hypothetical protein
MGLFSTKKAEPKGTVGWRPKKDITAYELAKAIEVFETARRFGRAAAVRRYNRLPYNIKRHFVILDNDE